MIATHPKINKERKIKEKNEEFFNTYESFKNNNNCNIAIEDNLSIFYQCYTIFFIRKHV